MWPISFFDQAFESEVRQETSKKALGLKIFSRGLMEMANSSWLLYQT